MLAFVIVAVFVAGLMVGRTPEYLGKKIEAYEMKMASLILLIPILMANWLARQSAVIASGRPRYNLQPRRTWLQRSAVRLLLGSRQQRQRLRRAGGKYPVLQQPQLASSCLSHATGWQSLPWRSRGSLARRKTGRSRALCPPIPTLHRLADRRHYGRRRLGFFPALALGPISETSYVVGTKPVEYLRFKKRSRTGASCTSAPSCTLFKKLDPFRQATGHVRR